MRIRLAIGVVLSTALIVPLSVPGAQAAQVNFPSDGTWVVPAGVEVVQVTVSGGKGGDGGGEGGGGIALGGYGVAVTAGLNVSPGETVYMGLGADGQNSTPRGGGVSAASAFSIGPGGAYTYSGGGEGGGGGGASAIAVDDTVVVIAGGGGGAGGARDLFSVGGVPLSGDGGNANRIGSSGEDGWGPGGIGGGQSGNTTVKSTLTRAGEVTGGGGQPSTDSCCNVDGGGGGAGYIGGFEGDMGGGSHLEAVGSGGGGGSSYTSPTRVPYTNHLNYSLFSGDPSGSIEYIDIATAALPGATVDAAFSTTLAATFGAAEAVDDWTVAPALPTGISLNATTGVLSGTAGAASTGTYTFTATQYGWPGAISARSNVSLSLTVTAAPVSDQTVTFDVNGGTGTMANQVTNVATALTANTFTRAGFTFAGWNTASGGGGAEYTNNASYPFSASETLYAQWVTTPTPDPAPAPGPNSGAGTSTSPAVVAPNLSVVTPGEFTWSTNVDSFARVATNSGSTARFTIDPELPIGLTLDPWTAVISGTATAVHKKSAFTVTAANSQGRKSALIYLAVNAQGSTSIGAPPTESVRFAAGSSKLTRALKMQLDVWLERDRSAPTTLTGVIPKSGNGVALASKRAIQVRKYLRANDANVTSIIKIAKATDRTMTRRVLHSD